MQQGICVDLTHNKVYFFFLHLLARPLATGDFKNLLFGERKNRTLFRLSFFGGGVQLVRLFYWIYMPKIRIFIDFIFNFTNAQEWFKNLRYVDKFNLQPEIRIANFMMFYFSYCWTWFPRMYHSLHFINAEIFQYSFLGADFRSFSSSISSIFIFFACSFLITAWHVYT